MRPGEKRQHEALKVAGIATASGFAFCTALGFAISQAYKSKQKKPQLRFKQRLCDNSDAPFLHLRPKSSDECVASHSEQQQQQVEAVCNTSGREDKGAAEDGVGNITENRAGPVHPYTNPIQTLLSAYNPSQPAPSSASSLSTAANAQHSTALRALLRAPVFPSPPEDAPLRLVKTRRQLQAMVQQLWQVDAFAVDVEHHSRRSYLGTTCLIQISTGDVDFIVDALALHDDIGNALRPLFASPHILKVLHGCSQDILWLQRDFHLYLVHIFDTEQAAMALGKSTRSLASLALAYCGEVLDKSYQVADWRQRPLPEDFVAYARGDVRYLLYLAAVLSHELCGVKAPGEALQSCSHEDPSSGAKQQQQQHMQQPQIMDHATHQGNQAQQADPQICLSLCPALAKTLYRSQLLTLQLYSKSRHETVVSAAANALTKRALAQHLQQQGTTHHVLPAQPPRHHQQDDLDEACSVRSATRHVRTATQEGSQQQAQQHTLRQQEQQQEQQQLLGSSQDRRSSSKGVSTSGHTHKSLDEGNQHHSHRLKSLDQGTSSSSSSSGGRSRQRQQQQVEAAPAASATSKAAAAAAAAPAGQGSSNHTGGKESAGSTHPALNVPEKAHQAHSNSRWGVSEFKRLQRILLALCDWRDWQARADDESPQFILPDSVLLALAHAAPITAAAVLDVLRVHAPDTKFRGEELMSRAAFKQAAQLSERIRGAQAPPTRSAGKGGAGAAQPGRSSIQPAESMEQFCASLGLSHGPRQKNPRLTGIDALPPEKREMMIKKFSTKGLAYENCIMLSKAGELLCHTDRHKVEWYLNRGIADKVRDEPLTIRLLFEHKKSDQDAGERFYTEQKINRCVVCGEEEHYLRFRVVPACYRRQFPIHLKSHRSHDVVLLCVRCHQSALKVSELTKRDIAQHLGIPLEPVLVREPGTSSRAAEAGPEAAADDAAGGAMSPATVRRAAVALQRAGAKMPASRRKELASSVREGLQLCGWVHPEGSSPIDPALELSAAELDAGLTFGLNQKKAKKLKSEQGVEEGEDGDGQNQGGHMWHGQRVVETLLANEGEMGLHKLIRRFREAFVQACQPCFLPHRWDVGHAAVRQYGPHSVFAASPSPPQPLTATPHPSNL